MHTDSDVIDRVEHVCMHYSKQLIFGSSRGGTWDSSVGDAEQKQELANPAVKLEAELGLKPTYDILERLAGRVESKK